MASTKSQRLRSGSLVLPGAHRIITQRAGRWRIYWYAWRGRGAPCVWSCVAGSRADVLAMERDAAREIAERWTAVCKPAPARGYVASLVADYKASAAWRDLAPRTRALWTPHLDAIIDIFGEVTLAAIQRRGARKQIDAWRRTMEATPRKANTALTVLVRVFEYGLETEEMERNPAAGMERLPEGPGRAGIVWTDAECAALLAACPPALSRAVRLAWLTGLRREDLIRLRWDEIDRAAGMIRRPTLKSGGKRIARIPISAELADLLDACPRTAVQVVTREDGAAYASPDGFSSALRRPMKRAGVVKHLHDMRGTCASRYFASGASDAEAEVRFGWAPGSGARMRDVYGDAETIAMAAAIRLQAKRR